MRYFGQKVRTGSRGGLYIAKNTKKRYLTQLQKDMIIFPKQFKAQTSSLPQQIVDLIMEYKSQLDAPKAHTFFLLLSPLERDVVIHYLTTQTHNICCHHIYEYVVSNTWMPKRIRQKATRCAFNY